MRLGLGNTIVNVGGLFSVGNNNQAGYASAILADSPYAYFRLTETSPSGSNSIIDSSGNNRHITPNGGITWQELGALSESSKGVVLNGSSGYFAGGAALATSFLANAAWTVELWFNATADGHLFAASGSGKSVAIQYYDRVVYASATGIANRSKDTIIGTWHHVSLNSAGVLVVDGVVAAGTADATVNGTNQLTIGALNNASSFFSGRIAEVALFSTALTTPQVLVHYNLGIARSATTARTFYHSFEQLIPDVFPNGSDVSGQLDQGSSLSTEQAYAGTKSLSLGGGTFRAMTFDNPTNQHVWCSLTEGRVRFRFRIAAGTGADMLMQITGKDRSNANDRNYSIGIFNQSGNISLKLVSDGGTETLASTPSPAVNTWHECVIRWRPNTFLPNIGLSLNGIEVTANAPNIGNFGTLTAWHHLLLGNDTNTNPTGFWLDEVEVFGGWE